MIKKKVLFIIGTDWASGYYRMSMACDLLKKSGFQTESINFKTIDLISLTGTVPNLLSKPKTVQLLDYDVLIFQLVWYEPLLYIMDRLKAYGKTIAMEIDDDYFALPRNNPSWISFHPKVTMRRTESNAVRGVIHKYKTNNKVEVLREACKRVDILQVSTPELADVYGRLNNNVAVLENMVENELYDSVPKRENHKPVIGWFGTRTHIDDLSLVLGCFPPQDKFILLLAGWPEVADLLFKDYKNLEVIGTYHYTDLPEIVKKCDVGIAPLIDNRFNSGKSDLKGVEFGAGGVPVIASDVAPYRRWIRHGENGFLVKKNKTKFWIRHIKQLIEDKKLRERLGAEAKKDAVKRDIRNYIDKWIGTYFL